MKMNKNRIKLRRFTESDKTRFAKLAGTKEVYATTMNFPNPMTEEWAEKWIKKKNKELKKIKTYF